MRVEPIRATVIKAGGGPADTGLSDAEFRMIAFMVKRDAGIVLSESKRDLVFGRLRRRLRVLGLRSFAEYCAVLDGRDGGDERGEMINAITTNLTSFFREPHHFSYLATRAIPEAVKGPRRLRIWSAACSSGEEPYTVAMVVQKAIASIPDFDVKILATDIDANMVEIAQRGIYPVSRAGGIPAEYARCRVRHDADTVSMPDDLKAMITFNQLNLLSAWPMRSTFDVIFCRNVVIYFDKETKTALFDRMADILSPGGTLFIGHSESLFRISDRFEGLGRTIYRKIR